MLRNYPDYGGLPLRNRYDQVESLWVKIRTEPIKEIWWAGSTTGCWIKGSLLMKPSCFSYKKHYAFEFSYQPLIYLLGN